VAHFIAKDYKATKIVYSPQINGND